MTRPNLTFFVEVELEPLEELFGQPEVVRFLAEHGCAISMGLLDLSPRRAAVVRELESRRFRSRGGCCSTRRTATG